jgi:8-oxo-dGTP diphosphatase
VTEDFTATLPRKRMGAGALLTDDRGRLLLVEPTYQPYFEIPGGAVEADESPHTAVVRELQEARRDGAHPVAGRRTAQLGVVYRAASR